MTCGDTLTEPVLPITAPEAWLRQKMAFVDDQETVADSPEMIVVGSAVRTAVGPRRTIALPEAVPPPRIQLTE